MKTINKKYLDTALEIRKTYLNKLKDISDLESELQTYTNELTKILNDLEQLNGSDENVLNNFNNIQQNIIIDINKNIQKIQSKLSPYTDVIKELENQSQILYNNIVEQYKDELNKEDIQKQIFEYVENNLK